jgi:hypothetical protein
LKTSRARRFLCVNWPGSTGDQLVECGAGRDA